MKLHRKFVFALLGVATFCVAIDSSALTLGRAKGAVFLGQALKLTIPIHVESGEGGPTQCFEADVFYGDVRQDASRVGVGSESVPQTQSVNVTITAAAVVDEPVVTVYVRAGCEGKISRRYVMLAELAPDVPPQVNVARLPASASPSANTAPSRSKPADKNSAASEQSAKRSKPLETRSDTRPELTAPGKPKPAVPQNPSRRAHLKLEPWDPSLERDPALKLSSEIVVDQTEDLQKRARALALWRALNATPQDVQNAEHQVQALETGLKGLHDTTLKNRQILTELTRRLEKAEAERYSNALVYGLLAILLLFGAGIAFAGLRLRRSGFDSAPWWRDGGDFGPSEVAVDNHQMPARAEAGSSASPATERPVSRPLIAEPVVNKPASRVSHVDIDLQFDAPAQTQHEPVPPIAAPGRSIPIVSNGSATKGMRQPDFASSMSATLRSVNTKEMLDVRQQADFFMTLGQHEEAIALLSESVSGDSDANPMVYLDLLKILHTLGRKMEYDRYRSAFNTIFNGYVPIYADFNQQGSGLEAYPHVCKRIVALWPTEEAIAYIETCLVRVDDTSSSPQLFDLGALRDLLMLHGVAKRIASSSFDSGFMPFSTAKGSQAEASLPEDTQPVSVSHGTQTGTGIDFDISEPPGNLIDFDGDDLLPPPPSASPARRRG